MESVMVGEMRQLCGLTGILEIRAYSSIFKNTSQATYLSHHSNHPL